MDVAATHLRAELVPHKVHGWRVLTHWARVVLAAVMGDFPSNLDLVVYRRDTGAEVMRTYSDIGSPEYLLDQVNDDLASKTVLEFFAEWRLDVDLDGPGD
jgi:hypothetical protein